MFKYLIQFLATSFTNAYNVALADTNSPALPTWNPPAVQPIPSWLQKRGVQ